MTEKKKRIHPHRELQRVMRLLLEEYFKAYRYKENKEDFLKALENLNRFLKTKITYMWKRPERAHKEFLENMIKEQAFHKSYVLPPVVQSYNGKSIAEMIREIEEKGALE